MGTITDPMLNEFRQEVATPKRVLERVPEQKLSWKPHAESMTLGQLVLAHCERSGERGAHAPAGQFRCEPRELRASAAEEHAGSPHGFSSKVSAMRSNACR